MLHREIYADIRRGQLADNEISTLLNVNRELLNSNIALVVALQDFSLREVDVDMVGELSAVV